MMKRDPATWQQMIADVSRGNQAAQVFLTAWCSFCHALDDLVDRDKPVDANKHTLHLLSFMFQVSHNEFYQANRQGFEALMAAAAMGWLEANERHGKPEAVFLKEQWFEVFFYAALLLGGWAHAREMSAKYREYDDFAAGP